MLIKVIYEILANNGRTHRHLGQTDNQSLMYFVWESYLELPGVTKQMYNSFYDCVGKNEAFAKRYIYKDALYQNYSLLTNSVCYGNMCALKAFTFNWFKNRKEYILYVTLHRCSIFLLGYFYLLIDINVAWSPTFCFFFFYFYKKFYY